MDIPSSWDLQTNRRARDCEQAGGACPPRHQLAMPIAQAMFAGKFGQSSAGTAIVAVGSMPRSSPGRSQIHVVGADRERQSEADVDDLVFEQRQDDPCDALGRSRDQPSFLLRLCSIEVQHERIRNPRQARCDLKRDTLGMRAAMKAPRRGRGGRAFAPAPDGDGGASEPAPRPSEKPQATRLEIRHFHGLSRDRGGAHYRLASEMSTLFPERPEDGGSCRLPGGGSSLLRTGLLPNKEDYREKTSEWSSLLRLRVECLARISRR
jgi:hypothetical protein